jgi:DNA-binding transcriptional LysR family regulator
MDLDLSQMRAFVAVADHRHFGEAASDLFLTPQALSKRILRLEATLSAKLFIRGGGTIECTPAGRRLLPHARSLLASADATVAAVRNDNRPLRVDLGDLVPTPLRALHRLCEAMPTIEVDVSVRRGLGDAVGALQRREIDAAFGRVQDLDFRWPDALEHRLVLLDPVTVAVLDDHPLATVSVLHPGELQAWGVWWPIGEGRTEQLGYARRFSEHFDVPVDTARRGVGPVTPIDLLHRDPACVVAWAASWPSVCDLDFRSPRLDPTPLFPWSLVWRSDDDDPALARLLELATEIGDKEGWLTYDPPRTWLPETDATRWATATRSPARLP